MRPAACKDAIILGGGISGLYAAYRLVMEAGACVVLLERSARLGGRIQTIYHPNGYLYEAGAGRFATHHRRLMGLLGHFGLHRSRIPPGAVYRPRGGAPTDAGEVVRPLLGRVLAAARRMPAEQLRAMTFGDLSRSVLGAEEAGLLQAAFGYNGEFEVINAADGCRMMQRQRPGVAYYSCREGLSALVARMEEALIGSGRCRIYRETTAVSFDFAPRSGVVTVRATDRTGGPRTYRARSLVAAIPQKELLELGRGVFQEGHRALLGAVEPIRLHRIYGAWSVAGGEAEANAAVIRAMSGGAAAPWFAPQGKRPGLPRTTTDGRLRMFIPVDYDRGLAMLTYSDQSDADYWENIAKNPEKLEATLLRELGIVFPELPARIPPPALLRSYYWPEGVHYWRRGVDSAVVGPQVQRLLGEQVPFFVVGEAFSHDQGWIEGALESTDAVFPAVVAAIARRR